MKSHRKLILFFFVVIGLLLSFSFILFLVLHTGHVGFAADAAPSSGSSSEEYKYTVAATIWNDTRQDVFVTVNTRISSCSFDVETPYPVGLIQSGETKECSFELDLQQLFEQQYNAEHGIMKHGPYTEEYVDAVLERMDVMESFLFGIDQSAFEYSITVRDQNNQIIEP